MAKRFTDTKIWDDPWFQSLPIIWKCFWKYACDLCDEAGVWKVNKRQAEFQINGKIKWEEMSKFINNGKIRIVEFSEDIWIIKDFVNFQYGEKILTSSHSFHLRVRNTLKKYLIEDTLSDTLSNSLLNRTKEKERDMEEEEEEVKEKEEEKEKEQEKIFECFRVAYPGSKRGFQTEYDNFCKKHKDWKTKIHDLLSALNDQCLWRMEMNAAGMFVPAWKNMQTWVNQRCWEEEKPVIVKRQVEQKKYGRQEISMDELREQAERIDLSCSTGFFELK